MWWLVQADKEHGFTDDASHITNIGRMIEEMESKLREELYEIYFSKTREVFFLAMHRPATCWTG